MTGKIYCISNDINDKLYIGKTVRPTLQERFNEHCKDSLKVGREKRPLYNAMRCYGKEHFSITLIEECPISQLAEREQYWIDYYNTYYSGYNATLGGDGTILYDYALFVEDYQSGMLVIEIAEKYGCNQDTVTNALHLAGIDGHTNAINRSKNKVYQYDKSNNFIQTFESQRDAARYLISCGHKGSITSIATNIGRVLKGQRNTAEGFIWKTE
jgi:hypothetical protein